MQRVLSVSLSHVIRSAAAMLLPLAFISLIAWATAGSSSGSTSDPIRGAIWIWLGAHHLPFQLALPPTSIPGYLTYLPIGGLVLTYLVIRATFNRAVDKLQGYFHDINSVRLIFAAMYALLLTIMAFLSGADAVTPQWYLAPIFGFFIALIATLSAGYRVNPSRSLRIALRITAILLGASLLVITALLIANFNLIKDITISLQPGFFVGILLLSLNRFALLVSIRTDSCASTLRCSSNAARTTCASWNILLYRSRYSACSLGPGLRNTNSGAELFDFHRHGHASGLLG